jgi:hypothetical protein
MKDSFTAIILVAGTITMKDSTNVETSLASKLVGLVRDIAVHIFMYSRK